MLSAFLSLYAYGVLMTDSVPVNTPHVMPWNENVMLDASAVAEKNEQNIAPVIEAKSAIVVDMTNGLVLYEKNIHDPLPIASLTKLMTTVIVIEENDPKDVVEISRLASQTEGSRIWLAEGEKITVENLLYASLIHSANDAAVALAEHNAGSVMTFVEKMNARAKELGMLTTNFVNPTGLDEDIPAQPAETAESAKYGTDDTNPDNENQPSPDINTASPDNPENQAATIIAGAPAASTYNYSTAHDLTLLARYAFGKSFIRRAATKKELEIASVNETLTHKLTNTNDLLDSYLPVLGLKTGTTDTAGECLISVIENPSGNNILTIVLNSPSRYRETKVLADWTFRTYTWK